MKSIYRSITTIGLSLLSLAVIAQQKQIPRIELMPDKPTPYLIKDWKEVAKNYDALVYDIEKTGTYLPLTTISTNADGVNYTSLKNMFMSTYVGQDSKNTAEAINILSSVVRATLVGIGKSNQNIINWVGGKKVFLILKTNIMYI